MTSMSATSFFQLLAQMNIRIVCRRVGALREQSRFMVAVIFLFVVAYWVAAFGLFRFGFLYLAKLPGIGVILLDRMVYLFFAFLFVMLVFSNVIIGYSTLFKNHETQWMLTLPVGHTYVYCWKLAETTLLASWAFLFLSAPLMLAYGSVREVTGLFYLKVFVLYLPFTMIPAALGSMVILLVTRFLHRRIFKWMLFGLGSVAVAVCILYVQPAKVAEIQQAEVISTMNQLLRNSQLAVQPMLPSYWVASSMIAWGEGWHWQGTFFFLVLISNAMMATLLCVTLSKRVFYESWSRNHSQGTFRLGLGLLDKQVRIPRTGLLERFLNAWPLLRPATRALILKDIRVFWRDTSQWSQFVIFFGLLGLYVLNLRNVSFDWKNEIWAVFVSFLNLGAASMTLATLTTRFVFPQFSLEGKRLWILGMAPYGLKRVLLEKFWVSSFWSVAITLTLTTLSSVMLQLPVWLALLLGATVVLMSFALCGIAVGIGALFPNFGTGSSVTRSEDNPAKIVSGFGGTFCFVLSLLYIALVIGAEALPIYAEFAGGILAAWGRTWVLVGSWILVSIISCVATFVPMSLALDRIDTLEF